MRAAIRLSLMSLVAAGFSASAANADQTDPHLDRLFSELRTSDDPDAVLEEIGEIWRDSQSDTVDLLYARAEAAMAAGALDLAGALLDHAVGLAPSFAQAHVLRGAVRLQAQDPAGAIADFSRAIELEPRQFQARIALAELMAAAGDARGAFDMLQKALEWNPNDPTALRMAKRLREQLDGQEI